MGAFKAYRIYDSPNGVKAQWESLRKDDLSAGNVVIRVRYSSVNYKDALAATGSGKILRRSPLVGGIDLSGEVMESIDPRYREGDLVLVTGCGLSETHDGGYAEYARVNGDWVIPLPQGLGLDDAMKLGTAGFTAGLAIDRMEQNGQSPSGGPIIVTGATGGVGSIGISMLAARGYEVVAYSGKTDADEYLHAIGATRIHRRTPIHRGERALETVLWGGAVDSLGGEVLAWLSRTVDCFGNIASIGLAAGADLHATVMPFILRGVSILGINSVANSRTERLRIWDRIASDLKPPELDRICTRTIPLTDLASVFADFIEGKVRGRTLVRVGP